MLKDEIKEFVFSRTENLNEYESKEYLKASEHCSSIFQKIKSLLNENESNLIFEYEEVSNEMLAYDVAQAYKKGFSDSFNLFLQLYKNF